MKQKRKQSGARSGRWEMWASCPALPCPALPACLRQTRACLLSTGRQWFGNCRRISLLLRLRDPTGVRFPVPSMKRSSAQFSPPLGVALPAPKRGRDQDLSWVRWRRSRGSAVGLVGRLGLAMATRVLPMGTAAAQIRWTRVAYGKGDCNKRGSQLPDLSHSQGLACVC